MTRLTVETCILSLFPLGSVRGVELAQVGAMSQSKTIVIKLGELAICFETPFHT